jgi:hypothetical protein
VGNGKAANMLWGEQGEESKNIMAEHRYVFACVGAGRRGWVQVEVVPIIVRSAGGERQMYGGK